MTTFEQFYLTWRERAFAYARLLTGGKDEQADDLVSLAMSKMLRLWPTMRCDDAHKFLFTVICNAFRDACRRQEHKHVVSLNVDYEDDSKHQVADGAREPLDILLGCELVAEATDAAKVLLPLQRDIIDCMMAEMTYESTSKKLGVPVGTIRSAYSRARRRLEAELGDDVLPRLRVSDAGRGQLPELRAVRSRPEVT